MTDLEWSATGAIAPLQQSQSGSKSWARIAMNLARSLAIAGLVLTGLTHTVGAQTGNDYYQAQSDKALNNLLQQVEKYHLSPGISNLRSGQYQYAYNEVNFILNNFPNHPQALVMMSEVCVKWKQPARCNADAYFQKALQVNPEAAGTYTIYGIHLQNTGRIDQAIENYTKALTINPTSRNAHYNLGLAYVNKKNFVQANEHAQQAYALGMTLPGLRNMLTKAGAWKPLPAEAAAPPAADAAPGDTPSAGGTAAK